MNVKKAFLFSIVFAVMLTVSGIVNAAMMIPAADQAKEHSKAPEKSPVINEDWELERVDFVHYAKPDKPGSGSGKGGKGSDSCTKLMGVKWKTAPVDYVINPTNTDGLLESFVTSTISESIEIWDNETSVELINDAYSVNYSGQFGVQNFENTIVFGSYSEANAIAVTSVWYTRKGKQIVEFDMLFNENFDWGDAIVDPLKMDLKNIAVHEFGHAVGLSDIYTDSCSAVTMYGYGTEGEISKRTLEPADISGLQTMYGI